MSRRRYALEALNNILEHGAYANLYLKDSLQSLPAEDAAWVSALVYAVLEHLYAIDFYIATTAKGRLQPQIRNILRIGICEILYMRTPSHAACSESVKLSKEIGKSALSGYVNAVLRSIGRMDEENNLPPFPQDIESRLSLQYGYPRFLVKEYLSVYGADFTEAMLSYRQQGTSFRVQPPYTMAEFENILDEKSVVYHHGGIVNECFHIEKGYSPTKSPLFDAGKITVQSESAMLVCRALDPKANERILDACAAPGGKSAYISALMQNTGRIDAWDLHPHRIELIQASMDRLHIQNVQSVCRDASVFDESLRGCYDRVLLDVPCSGLGLPNKPDIRYHQSVEAIASLAQIQRAILDCCCDYVKVGGVLLYSTCTISRQENEERILSFLERNTEFKLIGLNSYVPASMQEEARTGMLQLLPHLHQTEGFFIAKMEKTK